MRPTRSKTMSPTTVEGSSPSLTSGSCGDRLAIDFRISPVIAIPDSKACAEGAIRIMAKDPIVTANVVALTSATDIWPRVR